MKDGKDWDGSRTVQTGWERLVQHVSRAWIIMLDLQFSLCLHWGDRVLGLGDENIGLLNRKVTLICTDQGAGSVLIDRTAYRRSEWQKE